MKCEGVGLYRTEFPFIIRSTFPSEEEQVAVYSKLIKGLEGKPVTFRTLDIGGDKILSYYDHLTEQNPFLGLRSIRFALNNKDVFSFIKVALILLIVALGIPVSLLMFSLYSLQ